MGKIIKDTALGICVFNEEKTLDKTLSSILEQSAYPEKVIIVDGGSTDNTLKIINSFKSQFKAKKIKFNQLICKGSLAESRNLVVKTASTEIIAFTDAGCYAKKSWFRDLVSCLLNSSDVEISAGFYTMATKSHFSQAYACFVGVLPKYLDEYRFLPSTRSVAIRRTVFEKIGLFNEKLKVGEDTEFFYRAVKHNMKIKVCKSAQVVWFELADINLFSAAKKFYNYAKADALTGIIWHPKQGFSTHFIKILSVYIRYLFFIFLVFVKWQWFFIIYGIYLFYCYNKFLKEKIPVRTRIYFPLIQVLSDFAVMAGFFNGYISAKLNQN
ncbi:MAG: hypothetical protein KatS3mg091_076 [Patescibacteria group bacterium]|nr:MAG: hypothetical protein KatS3mg091_076 [Patescibacteria group bacterium]